MFTRIGEAVVSKRRLVVALGLVAVVGAALVGGGVASRLSNGGFDDPNSESARAERVLEETFGAAEPNLILLVDAGDVDTPAAVAAGLDLTAELAKEPDVEDVVSYWSLGGVPSLRSEDGVHGLVLGRLAVDDDELLERMETISDDYTRGETLAVSVGGSAEVFRQIQTTIEGDLATAERVAFPVTLLLLVLVFGAVVAAGLPLVVGGFAIVGTFAVLTVLTGFTEVSVFALNLTTAMGLGLGIDYSLFIVSRYREELATDGDAHAAALRTVATAGRTVAFSGVTVAISLASLMVFPLGFLRSFAYAGIAVVVIAAVVAVVFLPALLAMLGHRVDKLRLVRRRGRREGEGFWHRMATFVMRRPGRIAGSITLLLVLLAVPFSGVELGRSDDRVLPTDATVRTVQDEIRAGFDSREASMLPVVATGIGPAHDHVAAISSYAGELSALPGVARVDALTGSYAGGEQVSGPTVLSTRFESGDATYLAVVPAVEPISPEGETLVHSIRQVPAPFEVAVGGGAAELVDVKDSLFSRLPLALAIIAVVTFTLLFLMFGSVLVPLKAIVLNLLSLTATFGAMVWVFQDGHLADVLGFTPTGTIEVTMPVLMFAVAFGLSMDYEVFLLSRIKEEFDRTGDNEHSVATGLERTGRIVTAAALLLAVVLVAFGLSGVSFLKMFGFGMALAVLVDATLVRATLVPAFMKLAGRANWWAPRPLARFHRRFGIGETQRDAPALVR